MRITLTCKFQGMVKVNKAERCVSASLSVNHLQSYYKEPYIIHCYQLWGSLGN